MEHTFSNFDYPLEIGEDGMPIEAHKVDFISDYIPVSYHMMDNLFAYKVIYKLRDDQAKTN